MHQYDGWHIHIGISRVVNTAFNLLLLVVLTTNNNTTYYYLFGVLTFVFRLTNQFSFLLYGACSILMILRLLLQFLRFKL